MVPSLKPALQHSGETGWTGEAVRRGNRREGWAPDCYRRPLRTRFKCPYCVLYSVFSPEGDRMRQHPLPFFTPRRGSRFLSDDGGPVLRARRVGSDLLFVPTQKRDRGESSVNGRGKGHSLRRTSDRFYYRRILKSHTFNPKNQPHADACRVAFPPAPALHPHD